MPTWGWLLVVASAAIVGGVVSVAWVLYRFGKGLRF